MPRRIADERRARILAAVAETLHEEGLAFPSYDRVAGHAALSRQLVRHYFPDPEDLMVNACRRLAGAFLAEIDRRLEASEPEGELEALIDLCLDGPGGADGLPPTGAFESLLALARSSPALRRALQDDVRALNAAFARAAMRRYPDLAKGQAAELGLLLVAQVMGHWTMAGTLALGNAGSDATRAAMAGIIATYVPGR